jgi:methionyl-tRNA formyltransferase
MKIIFFGTPEYVNPIFECLFKNEILLAVITRSDKPAKRHLQPLPSAIKKNAVEKKITVFTLENLKDKNFISQIAELKPEIGIVAAYGRILPKEVLDIFPKGCVNIHFSLLPKYRGAAPIQWALINGESETGVTSFFMDEGLDTGKIIFQKKITIDKKDDTELLQKKLIQVAVDVLKETIIKIGNGEKGENQSGVASFAPPLKKENGKINWDKSAEEIINLIRGTKPWPGVHAEFKGENLRITDSEVTDICSDKSVKSGEIVEIIKNKGFVVRCNNSFLLVKSVQPVSKNIMSAWSFLQGHQLKIGDKLS